MEVKKVAWIRDHNAPIGKPASGALTCICGKKIVTRYDHENNYTCPKCNTVYTGTGWIIKKGIG